MRILLVQPITYDRKKNFIMSRGLTTPPTALMLIGAILKKAGHEIKIVDRNDLETDWLATLKDFQPRILGTTSFTTSMIADALLITRTAKKIFGENIFTIWGGVHPTILPEQTLEESSIDCVVIGEGEETIVELVSSLEHQEPLENVLGIGYKKDRKTIINPERSLIENLDSLPLLPWDLINYERYGKYEAVLYTSRGCPFNCSFCYGISNKRRWRAMSAQRVIAEIEHLKKFFRIRRIKFYDDNFTVDRQRFNQIIDYLPTSLAIYFESRAEFIDDALVERVKKFRDVQVMIGVESGSQRILDKLNKGTRIADIKNAFRLLNAAEIATCGSFIVGVPGETGEDLKLTWKLLKETNPTKWNCNLLFYNPGSQLYNECVAAGKIIPPKNLEEWAVFSDERGFINLSAVETAYLKRLQFLSNLITLKNYLLQFRVEELLNKFFSFGADFKALIKRWLNLK